jgi:hypothetical protein
VNEPADRQAPRVRQLLEPLVRAGVDFVLVGGMAGTLHGSSLPSFDVDVAYARGHENAVRLVGALEEIGVRLRGAPPDLSFQLDARGIENGANFTFATPHGDLDVLADVGGVRSYDELRAHSEVMDIAGLEVRVASIDHLIAMKRAANRPKDKLMLEEYIVIADERRRAPSAD